MLAANPTAVKGSMVEKDDESEEDMFVSCLEMTSSSVLRKPGDADRGCTAMAIIGRLAYTNSSICSVDLPRAPTSWL